MNLTTIQNFLAETQTAIDALSSTTEGTRQNAENIVNAILEIASNETIERLGWNPIQDSSSTKNYTLKSSTRTLYLNEPVRGNVVVRTNDFEVETSSVKKNIISLNRMVFRGNKLTLTAKRGVSDDLAGLARTKYQSVVHALMYSRLFKEGIIRSRSQGSDTVNYSGFSWLDKRSVDYMFDHLINYTNLE